VLLVEVVLVEAEVEMGEAGGGVEREGLDSSEPSWISSKSSSSSTLGLEPANVD